MNETQDSDGGQEAADQNQQQQNTPDFSAEFAALKAELEAIKSQQFASSNQQQVTEPQTPVLTDEQAKALKENPDLLAKWLKMQADTAKNEIRQESQKQIWDARTYEKFPLLKTDKEFSKRVTSQMREMISMGEYTKDNPMLLYRATQIAAAEYAPLRSTANKNANQLSSLESRPAPTRNESKPKIGNDDPRIRFAMAMNAPQDKIEAFRKTLGEYVPSNRRPTRRLVK